MPLVRKITRPKRKSDRWISPSHLTHVRKHACCVCDSETAIEAAHVRLGTDGGMSKKPSDYFAVPLCKQCHVHQHTVGEASFWVEVGKDPFAIIEELIKTSPKRREIEEIRSNAR